uniref:Fucosyltransferase n=1 Tax=Tetraodon nigroviridis TaxID=99883 RepID=H3DEF3_TETNG
FNMTVLGAGVLRNVAAVVLILASLAVLFLMYLKSAPSPKCHPAPVRWSESERSGNASGGVRPKKPVLLIWFWPENLKFDLQDCKRHFRIDSCQLSDDKSLAAEANGILIYHKAISEDLSNLPTSRTRVQRWIWFHPDSPSNTRQIPGIEALFNLTLTYRKDADIQVRWKEEPGRDVAPPPKKRTVCWIVDTKEMVNNSTQSYETYVALLKYIQVDLFDISSDEAKGEGYLSTIKSCKFYLSFESFVHRDYITEKFTAPLALGTVPVALGPPRKNYENFVPGSSFIHVNDFSDAAALAEHLQSLDRDEQAYLRYFDWRKFYTIGAPFAEEKHRFLHPICQACQHLGLSNVFRYVPDLYKWFLAV